MFAHVGDRGVLTDSPKYSQDKYIDYHEYLS